MASFLALWKKEKYHFRNSRTILNHQSLFKIAFILIFASILVFGLFILFLNGFAFLNELGGVGLIIITSLFGLFFLGLGFMLIISSLVASYSSLYRSEDTNLLISLPLRFREITLFKYIEATGLSSWAFFFAIIPFVGAYAKHENMSPSFTLWTFLFSLPFLALCCAAGTIITIVVVHLLPRKRHLRFITTAIIITSIIAVWIITKKYYKPFDDMQMNLIKLIPGMNIASNPLLPSFWVSEGILSLSKGEIVRGMAFFLLLCSSAGMLIMLIEFLGSRLYYDSWQRINGESEIIKRKPLMLTAIDRCLMFIPSDLRAISMKDIRIFCRDPVQWSQALIFFGLLALYFANLRSFHYNTYPPIARNAISFLNVFSVSAVMCSLGSRFVYPQLSLEGHAFWILGLAPTNMKRILFTKFLISLFAMLIVSIFLMTLSASMLETDSITKTVGIVLAVSFSFAISALSTGLGAVFIDVEQKNPSAIVSGFGGTLNLVLSLCFMLLSISPFGVLFHFRILGRISHEHFATGVWLFYVWIILITFISTYLPLRIATTSLNKRDF